MFKEVGAIILPFLLFRVIYFNTSKSESIHTKMQLRFYKEKVLISIEKNEIAVNGTYYFRNDYDRSITVRFRYPFPLDKYHEYPHHIEVRGINFIRAERDICFFLNFNPYEEKEVNIRYRQKLKSNRATYIVRTTRLWNNPIELAHFIIIVPMRFKRVTISFQPDSSMLKDDYIYYYVTRKSFFPNKDLIVVWE